MRHTEQLRRVADCLESLARSMESLAATADRAERTLLGPLRALLAAVSGR